MCIAFPDTDYTEYVTSVSMKNHSSIGREITEILAKTRNIYRWLSDQTIEPASKRDNVNTVSRLV